MAFRRSQPVLSAAMCKNRFASLLLGQREKPPTAQRKEDTLRDSVGGAAPVSETPLPDAIAFDGLDLRPLSNVIFEPWVLEMLSRRVLYSV
jgi:hypothetical protein